ncbi:MAG: 50S ribosomal protein L25 [Thermogutta sp.]|nr:MAG: 50S ribosomal protein L25 [Thermogutta sp.]
MIEQISVELRSPGGKRSNKRLRAAGKVPAILYGHKQENVCLSLPRDALAAAVRHGTRLIQLTGAVREQAYIKELQWDTWGKEILHVDLTRVTAHERVRTEVPIELRGDAPGVKEGGRLAQHLHSLQIECEVDKIPEKFVVLITELGLGGAITVKDIPLPEGAKALVDPDEVVVVCHAPAGEEEAEEAAPATGPAEPEVIGRKKAAEEEEEKKE